MVDFEKCTELELISFIKKDKDSPALDFMIKKYTSYVVSLLSRFHIDGNEIPEFIADASLGLYSAAVHYDIEKNVPFEPFAKLCIKRTVLTSLKRYIRAKKTSFTECIYIDDPSANLPERALEIFCEYADPQSEFLRKEEFNEFITKAKQILTPFEWKVFTLYIDDLTYAQIAEKSGHNIKSISNAVYRIRNKLSVINQ